MAPQHSHATGPSTETCAPARRPRDDSDSLIDWTQPDRNAHVLDWRQRAHEFGIVPADDTDEAVVLPARQLVDEDDPEAFDDQIWTKKATSRCAERRTARTTKRGGRAGRGRAPRGKTSISSACT